MTGKGRLFSQWQPQQEMLETLWLSYFPVDARQKVGEQKKEITGTLLFKYFSSQTKNPSIQSLWFPVKNE